MADLKKRRTSIIRGILGHDAAPKGVVERSMADLEKMLDRRFRDLNKQRAELARAHAPLREKLLGPLRKDPEWAQFIRKLRDTHKSLQSYRVASPKLVERKERVFLGSIGGTRVPAYDYPWTWSATSGSPSVSTSANVNNGQMIVGISTDMNNGSSASARAALGIFFSSPTECLSHFKYWANPALNYNWWDICAFDSAHSDGFIGLYAAEYDWSGGMTATPVDQMISLWSDDSWWSGASDQGSNSAYPLSANFEVDANHYYALWVWCGVNDSAAGWGTFSGSGSGSTLSITVPSISWEVG
ncbi:MAG TPA: hypothetical protein VI386_23455 [Candidatus Sulfotelmatobacter sp.]